MTAHEVPSARAPVAAGPLALVALAVLAAHALSLTQYGWFRDELYYLSCAKRLAWGYVDQPPLSIALLALVRALAGDSLAALRAVAALAGAGVALLAGWFARELGGGRFAQVLAAAAVGFAPLLLGAGHYWSMNVFDFGFWLAGTLFALRALQRGAPRDWLALGLVLGLGLLNKWSVAWLGAGIAVALVVTPARRSLATPWPWLGAALAGVILAPNLAWQVAHGWPTLEFARNASAHKMRALEAVPFAVDQLLALGPGGAPLWIAGLAASLARPRWRPLAIVWLVTLAILLVNGSARAEYLALAAPALFAAGAVWWERRGGLARAIVAVLPFVFALPLVPFALPCLPPARFMAWQRALRLEPRSEERHRMGALPQHWADMFGWPEMADSVARVAATLPAAERARAIVVVGNYGEAGALERFGAGRVPAIACQHNSWFYWPPAWDGGTAIFVGRDSAGVAGEFRSVEVAGVAGHPLAMPYERDLPIVIGRGFTGDYRAAWREGRHFE
ncbi:MAG: glycosyltransferase family 39 protein [Candidatus Eisenbacteria bacterium]|nr:glycosyltransferase family 39 protein [Candidatus Eisenbacteria bacterium]